MTIANCDISKTPLIGKNEHGKAMWLAEELESKAALKGM